jgi:hypothetical protein
MLASNTVLGWTFTLGILALIFAAAAIVITVTLRRVHESLEHRHYSPAITGPVLLVTGLALFWGLWLPVGIALAARWLWHATQRAVS